MGGNLKKKWEQFKRGRPGRRFQERYERNKRERKQQSWARALPHFLTGIVLILIGVVFVFVPGPAVLFFIVGGGFLADRSQTLARLLDWGEIKVRHLLARLMSWWNDASTMARGGAVVLGLLGSGSAAYLCYKVWS